MVKLKFANRELHLPLWPTLALMILFPMLVMIGLWQLEREVEKQATVDADAAAARAEPAAYAISDTGLQPTPYLRLKLAGDYLAVRQFLLDNRTHAGHAGFHVLTPFADSETGPVVLVNRGWVVGDPARLQLPDISLNLAPTAITGTVYLPPEKYVVYGVMEENPGQWPRVVQAIDFDHLEAALGRELRRFIVRLDADQTEGYVREWRAHYGISPAKHRGYAVQWFALALTLLVIYIVVNMRKTSAPDKINKESEQDKS